MLWIALGLFSLVAIIGMILISYIVMDKETPKGLAVIHGIMAAIGILILLFYSFFQKPKPFESLILFLIAAVLGFILILRDLYGKNIPKWLALLHGVIAISAFVFLMLFIILHAGLFF